MVVAVARGPSTASNRADASPFVMSEPKRRATVGVVEVEREVRVLHAAESRQGEPVPGPEVPPRLHLEVGERREVLVGDAPRHEVVVGAPGAEQPGAVLAEGVLPSRTTLASVMLAAGRALEPRPAARLSTTSRDESRSPYAAPNPPAVSSKPSTVSGLKALGDAEQPVGVVHLDAVHDGQVLVGGAAAHGEPAAEVVGRRHPGEGVEGAEDVVDAAGGPEDRLGGDRSGGTDAPAPPSRTRPPPSRRRSRETAEPGRRSARRPTGRSRQRSPGSRRPERSGRAPSSSRTISNRPSGPVSAAGSPPVTRAPVIGISVTPSSTTPVTVLTGWRRRCQGESGEQAGEGAQEPRRGWSSSVPCEGEGRRRGPMVDEQRRSRRARCVRARGQRSEYRVRWSTSSDDIASGARSGIQWLTPSRTSKRYGPSTYSPVSSAPSMHSAVSPSLQVEHRRRLDGADGRTLQVPVADVRQAVPVQGGAEGCLRPQHADVLVDRL